jgi:2-polyprenyl-6-methoxyphenol hydroxylase-like FAD-dependent oxidoreductase
MRIAVVGGSLAGLFTATLLTQNGDEVTVCERSVHGLQGRGAGLLGRRGGPPRRPMKPPSWHAL